MADVSRRDQRIQIEGGGTWNKSPSANRAATKRRPVVVGVPRRPLLYKRGEGSQPQPLQLLPQKLDLLQNTTHASTVQYSSVQCSSASTQEASTPVTATATVTVTATVTSPRTCDCATEMSLSLRCVTSDRIFFSAVMPCGLPPPAWPCLMRSCSATCAPIS
eukprot:961159-Prorocentrum_minimum.AAC.2